MWYNILPTSQDFDKAYVQNSFDLEDWNLMKLVLSWI